ncbi:MAG: protein kinase [Methanothrix sp.]|nr:protein kinase [Methanothrix sp.]
MPKVRSLKAKADYRGPGSKGKFDTAHVQIDWEGPVLHHKEGLFWKKLAFKDVVKWEVHAEPGGKPDKFGRLKILNIIRLHTTTEMREFALHPDIFESWLYWIIRSLVKHANISLSKEEIKQSPLLQKHKVKTTAFQNVSMFDRTHQIFVNTLNILSNPAKQKEVSSSCDNGEGGSEVGRIVKSLGSGGSGTLIYEIMKLLEPIKSGEGKREEPVAVKISGTDITDVNKKEAMTGLIKEARVLALLGIHPHIVGLVDTALAENRLCLFMEMGNCDLAHLINDPPPKHLVLLYAQGILAGIAHMHKCRIFHLDMKPQNVIICKGDFAKIIDFGLSRGAVLQTKSERFEAPGHWAGQGTNGYINPEAWDWADKAVTSEIDLVKRDSFAVGMTIINGLLGPFLGEAEVAVTFGEQQQHVLNRIDTWKDRLRDEDNRNKLRHGGLLDLAEAVIGLIEEDPQQRWTIERAVEFLKADRKKLRREHTSNRDDVLTALKDRNKKLDQLKKWGV